jgi:hypothetical protein
MVERRYYIMVIKIILGTIDFQPGVRNLLNHIKISPFWSLMLYENDLRVPNRVQF